MKDFLAIASEQKALYDLLLQAIKQENIPLFNSCLADNNKQLVYFKGCDGQSPIHVAAEFGRLQIMKLLVENYGVDINDKCGLTGYTPLMFACQNADHALIEYLLQRGSKLEEKSIAGRTAYRILVDSRLSMPLAELIESKLNSAK